MGFSPRPDSTTQAQLGACAASAVLVLCLAALSPGCGGDDTGPGGGGMGGSQAMDGGSTPAPARDGGGGTSGDGAPSGGDGATADPKDAGVDSGSAAEPTRPTGIYQTSGGGIGRSANLRLELSIGVPQPYGYGQSPGLRLQLGAPPSAGQAMEASP